MLRNNRLNWTGPMTRSLAALALAASTVAVCVSTPSYAQDNPQQTAPASDSLSASVDRFWHFGKIARYDLAVSEGNKVLASGAEPLKVLEAFEAASSSRKDDLDVWMLRWQGIEAMKDVTGNLKKVLDEGHVARSSDPKFIEQNIRRLIDGERAYMNGIARLRESGELAIPIMLNLLRDPAQSQLHGQIRRAMRDLGRNGLNPLCAATEMKENDTLLTVITVLGDLGYDQAAPYLARLANDPNSASTVKAAAGAALGKLGMSPATANAGSLFYTLGEKFYYDDSHKPEPRKPKSFIWYWSGDKGLTKLDVPPSIFNELMAMRAAEYALALNPTDEAQSLWLAANYKREVELPAGEVDLTRSENQPSAHFYGVSSGAKYLNAALARALKDKNSAVALNVIRSLQEIAGESNALVNGAGPLVDAMQYPDRLVRFEAAFAMAGALPQKSFNSQERVVPLLAEAIAQTGQPSVLVLLPTQDAVNGMLEQLKGAGIAAAGSTSASTLLAESARLAAVDVIVISEEVSGDEVERMLKFAQDTARLSGAARLILIKTSASPFEARRVNDPMLFTSTATAFEGIKGAIDDARLKTGFKPVDAEVATSYAKRAGELMGKLAISRGQVLDLSAAKPALLAALNDARPEIVMLAGNVLGLLSDKDVQSAMLTTATAEQTGDEVKVSLFKSIATNARFFGNSLEADRVAALTKVVATETNLDVRSAAAEAHGALNLPADQAKALIVEQSRK